MLFAIKKLLAGLLMPLSLLLIALLLALLLYARGKKIAAFLMTVFAVLSIYVLSLPMTARYLASPLEFTYQAYQGEPVQAVVVLGGGHDSDPRVPQTSILNHISYVRLSEGVVVYQQNPGAALLLSGYGGRDALSHADAAAQLAIRLGVNPEDIKRNPSARDTREEAQGWRSELADKRFALVTSAIHMPRAVRLFEQAGLGEQLVPAPTNYLSSGKRPIHWRDFLPTAYALRITEAAWHEYLGTMWASLSAFLKQNGEQNGL